MACAAKPSPQQPCWRRPARTRPGPWVSFDEVKRDSRSSDTAVLERNGELLQRVRTVARVRRGPWRALADISPALRTAMVLREDKRFYEHSGIDWRAVSAAAWGNASGAPMWDVGGTSSAAPVWAEVMRWLHAREPRHLPDWSRRAAHSVPAPTATRSKRRAANGFCKASSRRCSRSIPARALRRTALARASAHRSTEPSSRSTLTSSRHCTSACAWSPKAAAMHRRIDGKHFACGNSAQWLPWPERHLIELLDACGKMLDQRRLEVRGAGVRVKSAPMGIERLRAYAE
nr:transglycosylase domain-containing protein [Verminephrobacter eiseniae]